MKKLKIGIILLLIAILILIFTIIIINKQDDLDIPKDYETEVEKEFANDSLEKVNTNELMQIDGCIDKYLTAINLKSSLYFGNNENGEYSQLVDDNFINNKIIDFLNNDYLDKYDINLQNIREKIEFSELEQEYTILDISKARSENPNQYIVYGFLSENYNFKKYVYYIVTVDSVQNAFSIYPIEYSNQDISDVPLYSSDVEKNDNNLIPVVSMDNESVCRFYFTIVKNRMAMDDNYTYEILDDEYRKKRFENEEEFEEFLVNNKEEIENWNMNKYKLNSISSEYIDSMECLVADQYNNIYTITVNTGLDYKIKLDTYTILTDKFKTTYDESGNQYKVAMNVDKWIQMLNTRDYKTAYSYLDETFRDNNFGSEEAFEQYMRERYPLHYDFELGESTETNGTYTQTVKLTDITGEDETVIENTIIMQLLDDYEFVMSFEVN